MQKLIEMRRNKKGFTLVEVIVVLVILAILAAIAIPSLTGYIDKAKSKADMADARTAYIAAQTLASEQYVTTPAATSIATVGDKDAYDQINDLAGTGSKYSATNITTLTIAGGKVTDLVYVGGFATITFNNGTWSSNK